MDSGIDCLSGGNSLSHATSRWSRPADLSFSVLLRSGHGGCLRPERVTTPDAGPTMLTPADGVFSTCHQQGWELPTVWAAVHSLERDGGILNLVEPAPAHFDRALGAWILTTYADVSTALRDARLSISGSFVDAGIAHATFRDVGGHALSSQRVASWRVTMDSAAARIADTLPVNERIDLIESFARPWSTEVAAIVCGVSNEEAIRLAEPARTVFMSAANATDSEQQPETHGAIAELARTLQQPNPALAVQTFVAVSQTLACVLAGAWLLLARHPELLSALQNEMRTSPTRAARVLDELLRVASPTRAVFRTACADICIGTANITVGERVILLIATANIDPARFAEPTRVDPNRGSVGHLALGMGIHPCLGASLVRSALASATTALLDYTTRIECAGPADWLDGFAIRAPISLPVTLRRTV
jgi:cytochrome P450